MVHRSRAVGLALVVLFAACGSDDTSTAPPTDDALAASLLTVDDIEGDWTINLPPDAPESAASGVVPEELRDQLNGLEMCEAASDTSRAAVEGLRWQAFRQLDLTVDDPIEPPDRSGHMIFVQEYLTSADSDEIAATFTALRDGMQACLGDLPAGEEGPGTAASMAVPEVGDDRYGVLMLVEEAGGWAQWRLHNTLVRRGPVLMLMLVVEITAGEGTEPDYSVDDVSQFITTAVDKL